MRTILTLAPGGLVDHLDTVSRIHAAMVERNEDVANRPDHVTQDDAERLYGLRDGNPFEGYTPRR